MRIISIIIGVLAAVLGFILAFVLGTFAYIPVFFGVVFGVIAFVISKKKGLKVSIPKFIIGLSLLAGIVTTVNLFIENKLDPEEVERLKIQDKKSEEDTIKELEEEGL